MKRTRSRPRAARRQRHDAVAPPRWRRKPSRSPIPSDATADAAIAAGRGRRRRPGQDRAAPGPGRGAAGIDRPDPGRPAKATPSWKGAPQLEDKEAGWSFKPKGLMQYDAGYVGYPDGDEFRGTPIPTASTTPTSASTPAPAACGSAPKAPSRAASATRSRWTLPMAAVDFEDIILTYDVKNTPLTRRHRQFRPLHQPRDDDQLAPQLDARARRRSPTPSSTTAASASASASPTRRPTDLSRQAGMFSAADQRLDASPAPAGASARAAFTRR